MNERRMSLGNRILSLVLALVMVIGMMPAGVLSVFADTTGNPDVTSNADTILQYAQGKLNDNHDKTASFSWDTEGKSDGWRYFNGVMLQAFLSNGLQASETETAYSFAQNYFDFYINESGSTFDAVLNELVQDEYETADSELDGVPPARNLAQLVGHVGFTDDKYANAVKVIYNNTIGQTEVDNTGGNFIHKENNSSWANWKVGLDGIYMAQPFLMEVAKAVKEGRVDVGATYTAIADGVYNRLYWIANNMKYQTSDNVYLYHHGWGPGSDYKNGNGITWSRGTGWWVAGLADCIALMEDIGYDSTKITTLKGYLKEAIDGLLKYQHSSGLWYNVIYEQGEGTTTSNNFLEISGTGLFAYTIMKAYTRGWVTEAKYGQAALNAIDGIMGSSSYYSSGSFKNILKSSGVGTTVSYYNSTKSEDEAKGVGPIIMAASMYDDVKAMVSGGTKYTETFQIGAVNVTELPVVGTTVYANGLKATVVGSKGTVKDVTDLSATELSTELDGNKVKVLYNGNLIATVDAVIISSDATSGIGSFTVADSSATAPKGENTSASGTVTVEASNVDTGSYTYTEYTGTIKNGNFLIVVIDSSGNAILLANNSGTAENKNAGKYTKTISNGIITLTSEEAKYSEWKFTSENAVKELTTSSSETFTASKYAITNDATPDYTYYLRGNSSSVLTRKSSNITDLYIADDQRAVTGKGYEIILRVNNSNQWEDLTYASNAWNRTSAAQKRTAYVKLYEKTATGSGEDVDYTITLTAGSDGELLNKGDTKTLTATLTAAAGQTSATPTGSIVWDSSNKNVATVSSTGVVTAVAAGDAIITATVTGATVSGSEESVDLSIEIPVTVAETATYTVTLTLEPGSLVGKVNETGKFTPTVVIKNANNEDVTATFADSITYNGEIADTSIATVANDGTITYAKVGHTTFTQSATVNDTTVTATGNILVQADEAEHIHSYTAREEITQAPTCTATGSKKVYCSCGASEVRTISATGHSWNSGEVTKAATCNEAGTKTFTCTVCNTTKTEDIAALGHTEAAAVQQNVVAATCGAAGSYESVVYCSVCNAELSRTTVNVPATGNHTYGDDNVCDVCQATKPATNVTVTTGTTPSETEFVVATQMSEDLLYVIANGESGNDNRALYWDGNSWGASENTLTGPENDKYTLASDKNVTLWKWDSTGENTGYFYFVDNGTTYYLYQNTVSSENKTEYTVELGSAPRIYNGSNYLKVEKDSNGNLSFKSGNSGAATHLLTPVMTGNDETVRYQVEIAAQGQTVEVGKTLTPEVTITVKDADGNVVNNITATGTYEFTSGDTAKATAANGKITGVATGYVTVTAKLTGVTIGGVTASIDEGATITTTFTVTVTEATDGWELFTGTTIEEGWYIIVETDNNSYDYAMTNDDTANGTVTAVTVQDGKVVFANGTAPSNIIWTFKLNGEKWQVYNDDNYVKDGGAILQGESSNNLNSIVYSGTTGKYWIKTAGSRGLAYNEDNKNWVRQNDEYNVLLYKWTGSSAPGSSSGGTTPDPEDPTPDTPVVGSMYIHNFTEHGKTSDFYTIKGSTSTSKGSTSYDGKALTTCLKMESGTNISFTAPSAGTLTLVFGGSTSASGKEVTIDGTLHTVNGDGTLTLDLAAGSHTITKGSGDAINLFYMVYAVEATDGIEIAGPSTLYIGGTSSGELSFDILYGGQEITSGYELTVVSSNENAVKVEKRDNGKYYIVAQKAGLANITATLTEVGGTAVTATITDTLTVAVVEPTIELDEDRTMIEGQTYTFTPSVAYDDTAISNYTITLSCDNEAVTATLNADGTITLTANSATASEAFATVTATLTHVNGNPVTGYSDSMLVDVAAKTITKVDMAPETITISSEETLDDLLKYEKDVTLTFKYNDGSQIVVPPEDLTIDNSTVTIGEIGTYSAMLTYKNDTMGVDYAKALTVKILDPTQINAEGIASQVEVEYILDKDGTIEGNTKYLIVVGTDALMVPTNASGDNKGASNTVSINGEKAIVTSNAILTEWHFAGRNTSGNNQTYTAITNKDANGQTTYTFKDQTNFLDSEEGNTITLEPVNASKGQYVIRLSSGRYLMCSDGAWSRSSSSTEASEATVVTLYTRTEIPVKTHTVAFEVEGTGVACNLGVHTLPTALGVGLTKSFTGTVKLDGVFIDLSRCVIEWSVENADYLSISNGTVTGVKDSEGTKYKVYAKLISVDGMKITDNDTSTAYLLETIEIEVAEVELVYRMYINGAAAGEIAETATGTMYLPLGENPDLNKVEIKVYQRVSGADTYVETYQLEDLIYNVADSTLNVDDPGSEATITVKKRDNSAQIGTLTIKVGTNATQYREAAEKPYPEYPDEGAVRLDKIATGVGDFANTAIAKIELKVAGVSTSSPVDVVLIVDVSNSMGWVAGTTGTTNATKIPSDGVTGTDKLDNAMASATAFAEILLKNNETGKFNSNNTITFATFAGNDTDRAGGDSAYLDAMQTVFCGQDDLAAVKKSFSGTMFTGLEKLLDSDGKETGKVKYTLKLVDDKGNTIAEKENAGGTNYDYAFLQGKAAVEAVKAKWEAENPGKTYAESGRELHVIFMTDGIPSHYNGKYYRTGSQRDGFTSFASKNNDENDVRWITEVKSANENATDLYAMVTDIHTIGFDLGNGGLKGSDDNDYIRILSGLVENRKLECELAENSTQLKNFFTELAESLAFAGTSAVAVDTVGNKFVLQTASFNDGTNIVEPTIEILSRRLVLRSDIGSTLLIIGEDGTSSSVVLNAENIEKYLGAYVDEEPEVIEKVEFNGDNVANSSLLDGDIWNETTNTITGKYFTYNTVDKKFTWNIDDITDREISLVYYGYLYGTGKQGETKTIANGTYPTNEKATLQYIDTNGKIAESEFPVPYMPWGSALVTFRFYLVNPEGKFVNRANVTFDSPANRIFLTQRKSYELGLGATAAYNAKDVLSAAGLAGETLYDPDMAITLTTSGNNVTGSVAWNVTTTLANIGNLKISQDLSGGEFSNVIVDIPVVLTGLGESDQKMSDSRVVIDFSNPVQWDALAAEERLYDGFKYQNVQYTIELVGFAPYDPNVDLKDYLPETVKKYDTLTTEYGTYEMVADTTVGDVVYDDQIKFTPNAMLNGTDHVLAVFKFANQDTTADTETKDYYYMYKLISVVPATVVHYETSGNMSGAFEFTAVTKTDGTKVEWENDELGTASDAAQNINDGQYGYDASYDSCINYAGGTAMCVVNDDPVNVRPSVTFSFTGTGIDIISRTGKEQGMIKLTVTGEKTGTKKTAIVLNKGVDELYQLPVLSVEGLPYDTYKAEIIVYGQPKAYNGMAPAYGGTFCFDAIRVYGAAQETEVVGYKTVENGYVDVTVGDLYKEAGESAPQFFEVRDILLGNKNFGDISAAGVSGAVYIDGNATQGGDNTNFADYEKIGPNNEVYLSNNQAIAFKLKATDTAHLPATLAIGLKSVNTAVDASIIIVANGQQYNYSYSVATSTAMFYDLFGADKLTDFPTDANGITIVIANKDDGILSVTDLKVAYGNTAGQVDVIVDTGVAEDANAALEASARVESVEVTGDAYAMQTTSIRVVTGQAARSVEIVDSNGNMVAVKASFTDSDDGERTWTILATFTNAREEKITVYGIGADGNRHETSKTAPVNVQLAQRNY